ncbi:MAG: hypothetical protein ACKO37_00870 [Vampirovibrionales bacterium]
MRVLYQCALPPRSSSYSEIIRFLIQSLHPEEQDLMEFLVGCLNYCYRFNGLTDAQSSAIDKIYSNILLSLRCQFPECYARHFQGGVNV